MVNYLFIYEELIIFYGVNGQIGHECCIPAASHSAPTRSATCLVLVCHCVVDIIRLFCYVQ